MGIWSYLILALLVAVEGQLQLCSGPPLPRRCNAPVLVFFAASAGNLTADTLWYSIGHAGKLEWFLRFGRRLGISHGAIRTPAEPHAQTCNQDFVFAKLSMSLMIPSLIAAGLVKAPWRRWFPAVFGGEVIWTGSLVIDRLLHY